MSHYDIHYALTVISIIKYIDRYVIYDFLIVMSSLTHMLTCPCNLEILEPTLIYIVLVKVGFTGINIILACFFSNQRFSCWYYLEPHLTSIHNIVLSKFKQNHFFFLLNIVQP